MFAITDYSEVNGVSMTIVYTINGQVKEDKKHFDGKKCAFCSYVNQYHAKEEAMRYFASAAHTYLTLQVDIFHSLIKQTARHYLDNELVPYINDNKWTAAYWTYLELQRQLPKVLQQHYHYANLISCNLHIHRALIPELKSLGRDELQTILFDIEETAKLLKQAIRKIQDGTCLKNFAPIIKLAS